MLIKLELTNFEQITPHLKARLVSKSQAEGLPHIPFLDMAMIVAIELGKTENGHMSIKVNHHLLERWNESIESVMEIARANTFRHRRQIIGIEEVLGFNPVMPMLILTNADKYYGATQICQISTIAEIAEVWDSDLIVIPSSVHEVMIFKKQDGDKLEELARMVKEVNETIAPHEILSDHVYVFRRDIGWGY